VEGGGFYSRCARLVCGKLPGMVLGGQIAAGTHGRVFRADYNCMKVSHVRLGICFCYGIVAYLKYDMTTTAGSAVLTKTA
jgi:hypothetical protein